MKWNFCCLRWTPWQFSMMMTKFLFLGYDAVHYSVSNLDLNITATSRTLVFWGCYYLKIQTYGLEIPSPLYHESSQFGTEEGKWAFLLWRTFSMFHLHSMNTKIINLLQWLISKPFYFSPVKRLIFIFFPHSVSK